MPLTFDLQFDSLYVAKCTGDTRFFDDKPSISVTDMAVYYGSHKVNGQHCKFAPETFTSNFARSKQVYYISLHLTITNGPV